MPNPCASADRAHEKSLNGFERNNDAWELEWQMLVSAWIGSARALGHDHKGYLDIIEKAAADLVDLTESTTEE